MGQIRKTKAELVHEPKQMGRPPIPYLKEYGEQLIEHMKGGNSFESFATRIPCAVRTLYNFLEKYEDFLQAKKIGEAHMRYYFEEWGKRIAYGQLKRIKSEKVARDKEGNPIKDPRSGEYVIEREYEYGSAGQSTFIFMAKNMIGWRDKTDIGLSVTDPDQKQGAAQKPDFEAMTDDQLRAIQKTFLVQLEHEVSKKKDK